MECILRQRRALEMASDPALDEGSLALPAEVQTDEAEIKQDLRLVRAYALAIEHYAFWRHPPGSVAWLAAGAVEQRRWPTRGTMAGSSWALAANFFLANITVRYGETGSSARADL